MVLRTEFHEIQPAKNPHRDAYKDVIGGGKKEKKIVGRKLQNSRDSKSHNFKTIILNPKI